jgi:hypothetical protein
MMLPSHRFDKFAVGYFRLFEVVANRGKESAENLKVR